MVQVACGASHVLAVSNEREVFAWGRGDNGKRCLLCKTGLVLSIACSYSPRWPCLPAVLSRCARLGGCGRLAAASLHTRAPVLWVSLPSLAIGPRLGSCSSYVQAVVHGAVLGLCVAISRALLCFSCQVALGWVPWSATTPPSRSQSRRSMRPRGSSVALIPPWSSQ